MIEGIIQFMNQLLTFYIPTFYTFKFLMSNNNLKIRTVLKFWCILTLYHLLQQILSNIIAENLFPIIDLIVLVVLNWNEMVYGEVIFDTVVGPTFRNNQQNLQSITSEIENIFNNKTAKLKQKMTDSTTSRLKGFLGQILVGVLNPSVKSHSTQNQKDESSSQNQTEQDQQDQ